MVGGAFLKCLVCFYFFANVFNDVCGYTVSSSDNFTSLSRVRRAPKKCDGFRCVTSGKCIKLEKRCDGKVDCEDGSDEFNDCKTALDCPGYLFTCDYGGCIDKDKVCNGKKDCRDNSDETHCVNSNKGNKISSNCKSNQFQCLSGQCISLDYKCDGTADCGDKSDETKDTCLNTNCPGYTFVCDYGACVDGYAKCNGIKDCIDNSDEQDCPNATTSKPTVTVKPTPPPVVLVPQTTEGCILPELPANGKWTILGGAELNPGTKVAVNTLLIFNCDPSFKLSSENPLVACMKTGWNIEPPSCQKLCPTLYDTETTHVKCYDWRLVEIKCDSATDDSTATFECAPYYEAADRTKNIKRYCFNGLWDLQPPQCLPVCGEKRVSAVPLIVNGKNVEQGNYPWVTAIFHKNKTGYTNVCGGSMLTQRLIITAAHCVSDENDGTPMSPDMIKVGVGKYYNEYKDRRDTQSQYSDVMLVNVHSKYHGVLQNYANDIAFLVTKDVLLLSKVVQPVCYHNINEFHLHVGMTGVITGWGYTQGSGSPSGELKEIAIPYKDDATCSSELPKEWLDQFLTNDKFCAGHYNKSISVCNGDSGGGLVFQRPSDGRYYIQGLVSLGVKTEEGCAVQLSSLYTKVEEHYDWLEKMASRYK